MNYEQIRCKIHLRKRDPHNVTCAEIWQTSWLRETSRVIKSLVQTWLLVSKKTAGVKDDVKKKYDWEQWHKVIHSNVVWPSYYCSGLPGGQGHQEDIEGGPIDRS